MVEYIAAMLVQSFGIFLVIGTLALFVKEPVTCGTDVWLK